MDIWLWYRTSDLEHIRFESISSECEQPSSPFFSTFPMIDDRRPRKMDTFMQWTFDRRLSLCSVYPHTIVPSLVRRTEAKMCREITVMFLGLCLSSTVPGFLVTSSFDDTVKIWDIENGNVTYIAERQFQTVMRDGSDNLIWLLCRRVESIRA
jgi:WD40 repeat protein